MMRPAKKVKISCEGSGSNTSTQAHEAGNLFSYPTEHGGVVMVGANLPSETLEFACRSNTSPNKAELIAMANVLSPQTKFEDINLEETKEISIPVEDIFQILKPAIMEGTQLSHLHRSSQASCMPHL